LRGQAIQLQRRGELKKADGAGRCSFPTDSCTSRRCDLPVAKIPILPLDFPQIGVFSPKYCILTTTFQARSKFSENQKFRKMAIAPFSPLPFLPIFLSPAHDTTPLLSYE